MFKFLCFALVIVVTVNAKEPEKLSKYCFELKVKFSKSIIRDCCPTFLRPPNDLSQNCSLVPDPMVKSWTIKIK